MALVQGQQAIEAEMLDQGKLSVICADSVDLTEGHKEEVQKAIEEDKVLAEIPVDEEVKEEFVETKRIDNLPDDTDVEIQMNHLRQEYLKVEAYVRKYKEYLDELNAIVDKMVEVGGVGYHWESKTQKAVFQVVDNFEKGIAHKTVTMTRYSVAHTRRKCFDEKQGSLSLTAAKELGYSVD